MDHREAGSVFWLVGKIVGLHHSWQDLAGNVDPGHPPCLCQFMYQMKNPNLFRMFGVCYRCLPWDFRAFHDLYQRKHSSLIKSLRYGFVLTLPAQNGYRTQISTSLRCLGWNMLQWICWLFPCWENRKFGWCSGKLESFKAYSSNRPKAIHVKLERTGLWWWTSLHDQNLQALSFKRSWYSFLY